MSSSKISSNASRTLTMLKVSSLNNQKKCIELAGVRIGIFFTNELITIVQTIVPSRNLV